MTDILLKYKLLNKSARQEVIDFIDFLLSKQKKKVSSATSYREKLLKVSSWSESDIETLTENAKRLNNWNIREW